MIVAQVIKVSLKPSAQRTLSFEAYTRTVEWLKTWTPRGNFKAVIAEDREQAVKLLRQDLQEKLIPSWLAREQGVSADVFQFQIAYEAVEDGRFWSQLHVGLCQNFDVLEDRE